MTDFKPPISERTKAELLEIIGRPDQWISKAVDQALLELSKREVSDVEIKHARQRYSKEKSTTKRKLAEESFHLSDFIHYPIKTLFDMTISWELEKDGYLKKARQQKWTRLVFVLIIAVIFYCKLLL